MTKVHDKGLISLKRHHITTASHMLPFHRHLCIYHAKIFLNINLFSFIRGWLVDGGQKNRASKWKITAWGNYQDQFTLTIQVQSWATHRQLTQVKHTEHFCFCSNVLCTYTCTQHFCLWGQSNCLWLEVQQGWNVTYCYGRHLVTMKGHRQLET